MLPAGYRALDCLRLEKGYRVWGTDLTPVTSPLAAGLGFAVALDKPVPFIGREALERDREPARRLRALVLDDREQVVLGFEAIRAAGEVCGYVTSGGYGYRIDASVAYGYLPAELGPGSEVEISLFDEWVPAQVTAEPLYDAGTSLVAEGDAGRFNDPTVGVAQLVELLVVVQAVGGSSPLAHPRERPRICGSGRKPRARGRR